MSSPRVEAPSGPGLALSSDGDVARRRGLRRMRVVATSLLAFAAVVYVLTREQDGAWAYVNAAAEAAMVGAIADWFAVTALFRHPLGLPIPHTAIIPRRKASLGASLQDFVTENFLREDVVRERVLSAEPSRQVGAWLQEPENARQVVSIGSRALGDALARVRRDDVAAVISDVLIPRVAEEPLSAVAGELLEEVLRDRSHVGAVDLMVAELDRWLSEHVEDITEMVEQRAPWWTPTWVDQRLADRLYVELVNFVRDIAAEPEHPARLALDGWLTQMADSLQHDPDTMERFERMKRRMIERPQLVSTSVSLWDALRRALIDSLSDTDGLLRRRVEQELVRVGERLQSDQALAARADGLLADGVGYVVTNYGDQIATIISTTVERWDGKETAERVELHVGRDLQFIRINGTVVGGLAGLVIHTLSHLV